MPYNKATASKEIEVSGIGPPSPPIAWLLLIAGAIAVAGVVYSIVKRFR